MGYRRSLWIHSVASFEVIDTNVWSATGENSMPEVGSSTDG